MKSVLYVTNEEKLEQTMSSFKKGIETDRNACLLLTPDDNSEFIGAIVDKTGAELKKA